MDLKMSEYTAEGTKVRNLKTGKVWTVLQDLGTTKLLESYKGTLVRVTPEFYHNWIEVMPIMEPSLSTGPRNEIVLH